MNANVFASAAESNSRIIRARSANCFGVVGYGLPYRASRRKSTSYTRQCSLSYVTAKDLCRHGLPRSPMAGVNPLTKQRVIDAQSCKFTLAVMATAGLYETSGDWLYEVGLPGKSGIGGGIRDGFRPVRADSGTFAPRLDDAFGNSIKGQLAAQYLSERLGLSLLCFEGGNVKFPRASVASSPPC